MLAVLAALVSAACIAASARALRIATTPTWLEPAELRRALQDAGGAARLREVIEPRGGAAWEVDVLAIAAQKDEPARDALASECLVDLDGLVQRWRRVPRVCASVATSSALFLAIFVLIGGLTADPTAPSEAIRPALDALAMGAAGATFCAAVHMRCGQLRRASQASAERLVERVRSLPG